MPFEGLKFLFVKVMSAFHETEFGLPMQFMTGLLKRLALAMIIASSAVSAVWAENISVRGNSRTDAETIRSYFSGTDQAKVNQAVKDLYATGLYSSVQVRNEKGGLVVSVVENNVINRVAFEGNSKIKGEVLSSEVQSKSRGPYSPSIVQADIQRILDLYKRTGRGLAKVTSRTVDLPNGRLDVVFTISEGEKTGVKSIDFVGNEIYSSGKLRGLMQTTEMNLLSWIKTTDVYDPDRISSDLELIRRYYLKNGYADFRITNSDARFDAEKGGYIVTVTVEEGAQYRVGDVRVESRLADVDGASLQRLVKLSSGDVYNGDAVEKSTEALTKEVARRGYAFSQVRPKGDRDSATHLISLGFVVEEGPRVYIEKINVVGNTRTRDYVVRREFDIGEGDAYNRVLIDRAERRLNNLGYFKKVKITNEPGSAPDRVVVNIDVEDQPTGSFAISGGYSTTDGLISEVSITESNFLGRGQFVRLAGQLGQHARGVDFSFTEPYFLDQRVSAGFDLFHKQSDNSKYSLYQNWITGGTVRFGLPITEELSFSPRYSLYQSRIRIPNTTSTPYNDCTSPIVGYTPGTTGASAVSSSVNCLTNGEASLAVKETQGNRLTSLVGYSLAYNALDNVKLPTSGYYGELKQDFAGLGGDSRFVRTTGDLRVYRELVDEVVGFVRLQGGNITGYGGKNLRIADNFNLGPSLVRGFAPGGIGPRDISDPNNVRSAALGGTSYFGATAEVQFPIWGLPKELGLKGALFADAGTLFGYKGRTSFPDLVGAGSLGYVNGVCTPSTTTQVGCINVDDSKKLRSSVGASILWASPLGPIRFDYAFVLSKGSYDVTQAFRFSGGTSF